jgi:hypothetical protein
VVCGLAKKPQRSQSSTGIFGNWAIWLRASMWARSSSGWITAALDPPGTVQRTVLALYSRVAAW